MLTDDERPVITMVHITFEWSYNSIYNCYLKPSSLVLNCQEDPSTQTQAITRNPMCLLTGENNDKSNHNTTTYWCHIKLDGKKHSYNYQFYVLLFRDLFLHISHSETYSLGISKMEIENNSCQVWFNLCQRFRLEIKYEMGS